VFGSLHLPDAAAYVGAPLAIASAIGGADNSWHRRANGTDAHAMLVEEFVPLLVKRLGKLPVVPYGFSMGGYGALLAAEPGAAATGENFFGAVATASPALWTVPGGTAPGAFDSPSDFYSNDVFSSVQLLRSIQVRLDCGEEGPVLWRNPAALRAHDLAAPGRLPPRRRPHVGLLALSGAVPDVFPGARLRLGPRQLSDFWTRAPSSAQSTVHEARQARQTVMRTRRTPRNCNRT
jgi:hypothetical protein